MADNVHKAALETLLKSKGPPLGSKLDEQELQLVLECSDILVRERIVRADLLEGCSVPELTATGIPLGAAKTLKKAFPGVLPSNALPQQLQQQQQVCLLPSCALLTAHSSCSSSIGYDGHRRCMRPES